MTDFGSNIPLVEWEQGWNNEIKANALDPLENMLDSGFNDKTETRLFNHEDYSKVYATCYNMCTQKSPHNWASQLYSQHGETISNYLNRSVLPVLKSKRDEVLLQEFVRRGENHKIMNKWYRKFFMYLDRYHVKYFNEEPLEEAGIGCYKRIVFDACCSDVTNAIVKLINVERNSESVIDKSLIRNCIQIYETIGMGTLSSYINDFEAIFLQNTRAYYATKSEAWLEEDSTPIYMQKVEAVLEREKQRVQNYLNGETESKLMKVLEEELLEKKETQLIEKEGSGCKALLINDCFSDISRMYELFLRVPDGLQPISEIFRLHIVDVGSAKIDARMKRFVSDESEEGNAMVVEKGESSGGNKEKKKEKEKETNDDPEFIKDLLNIHDKYIKVVEDQFKHNPLFQRALKDSFMELVNRDTGKFKTADLISSYCDRLLKSGSAEKLSDLEVEQQLEKTVQLFSYLTDKDIFADIYRHQLAKRLLNQRSASDDMEKVMIGKMKMRCGAQFTVKMEGMLNDLAIAGTDFSQSFDSFCKDNPSKAGLGKIEFSVQVLTGGHWPTYKTIEMAPPTSMQKCLSTYNEFYLMSNANRRLQWAFSLGSATIKGNFAKGKSYDLVVSTLQAVALLCFNDDKTTLTFDELVDITKMEVDVLKRTIHSLSCGKYKVLKRIPESKGGLIKETDSFVYNETFSCNLRKIRIPMASLDDTSNNKRVEEDRGVAIEAATVRIMKARKTLTHQQLISEVLTQLAFFSPTSKDIKKKIESLIEREYLQRDAQNPQLYKYLA